jgi:hypothetical protein
MLLTVKYFFIFLISFIQFYNSGNSISSVLTYLLLTSLFIFNSYEISAKKKNKSLKLFYSKSDLLIALFVFAVIRSFFANAIGFSTLVYLVFILLFFTLLIKSDVQKPHFFRAVLLAFFGIVIINLLLYLIGINANIFVKKVDLHDSRILEYIGISLQRSRFFIFNNFAYYSMMLGILFIGRNYIALNNKYFKYAIIGSALLSFLILDARGPFFALIIVIAFKNILYKLNAFGFLLFCIAIGIIPFAYSLISIYFGLQLEDNLALVSSRDILWQVFFLNYDPSLFQFVFGYGYLGQYISGISPKYAVLFTNWGNASQISLHNSYLQYIMDLGIIGVLLLYKIIKNSFKKIEHLKLNELKLLIYYFLLLGISDMSIQINNFVVFYFFIILVNFVDQKYRQSKLVSQIG